jgi:hypothetical protein
MALASAKDKPTELPVQVTVCQLENHPNLYDRKLVEVTGRVYVGKFDFIIDAACKPHSGTGVWLDMGGDVLSPEAFWGISSYLLKQKGVEVKVRGVPIPVVHDNLLDEFVNDVGAIRFRKPNGDGCGSECLFYQVTATVRGRFFSGAKGGFGMNECCHLLVIEKIMNVSSTRTRVPAGGQFQCTSERWQPTPEELKTLSAITGCSLRDDFRKCDAVLAKHWGDTIDPRDALDYPGKWMLPDMTLSYAFAGGFIQKPGQPIEMTPSSFVVRQACRPVVAPKPASDHIYCQFYRWGGLEDRQALVALQKTVDDGKDTWRASDMAQVGWSAFEDASKQWNLGSTVQVKLSKCEPWPPGADSEGNQQQWGYCTWFAPDDMQEITVQFHKPGYLTKSAGQLQQAVWEQLA